LRPLHSLYSTSSTRMLPWIFHSPINKRMWDHSFKFHSFCLS
jgi:hypothetical protein